MSPGDPVRVYCGRKVHRVRGVRFTMRHRKKASVMCGVYPVVGFSDVDHTGRAATHRKDGTAYPLCRVCWPDAMPSGEDG